MAKKIELLNPKTVEAMLKPGAETGRHADGGNLYLKVGRGSQRSWVFWYRWQGKWTEHGLGSAHKVGLAAARKAAKACRDQLQANIKPGSPDGTEPGAAPTFGQVADEVIEAKAGAWKGDGHHDRWTFTLSRRRDAEGKIVKAGFCMGLINRPVNAITTQDIVDLLKPIWLTQRKTARDLRGRIETVLGAATAAGHRTGENPARWKGHLQHWLATQDTTVKHYPAHPYQTAPQFMARLRADTGTGARLLEFLILTWTRTDEAREALWSEIDRANATWTIPASRTKKNREHRVPLSPAALRIVDQMAKDRPADCDGSSFVFPGTLPGRPLSTSPLPDTMARLEADAYSVHGWRSCARDWAGEATAHPHDICEAALAHARKDKTHAAYQRGDLLAKRARLMEDWSRFLTGQTAAKGLLRLRRLRFRPKAPALRIAA